MPYLLCIASVSGFLAVALGAFAAHGLENLIDPDRLQTFSTGVEYHMYHSLALLAVAVLAQQYPTAGLLRASGHLFVLGILLFSGSLYVLSLTGVTWLGAVAPLGGASFLAGWASLLWFGVRLGSPQGARQ